MGLESSSSGENTASALEAFKNNPDAPFETVAKNEQPPGYPYVFFNKLKINWFKVCQLMDWQKTGKPVDWNFFRVAQNPFQVVRCIQNKILENGGSLPKYGVDGKFGSETESALGDVILKKSKMVDAETVSNDVTADLAAAPSINPDQTPRSHETVRTVSIENAGSKEKLMQQKMHEVIDAMPRIEARLKAANLNIDKDWLKNPNFSDTDVAEFQTRAMQFREDLIEEEPKLKPLEELVKKIIPEIEAEVKKIDLSKINSMADLMQVFKQLDETIKVKMDSYKDVLSDEKLEELIQEVDIEVLMAFFMSSIYELTVLMAKYFKENKQNFERIMKIFGDEFLIHVKPSKQEMRVKSEINPSVSVNELPKNWDELVAKGPFSSGKIEFAHQSKSIVLNLDNRTIIVGDKTAHLILPEGITLNSIQVLPNGGLELNAGLGSFSGSRTLSRADLNTYLGRVMSASDGDHIDIGQGAYLQV